MDQADFYDEEIAAIGKISYYLSGKYGTKWNLQKLEDFEKEAKDRFNRIGLDVRVSTAEPQLGMGGPVVEILGRLSQVEFDHEKKAYEIKKARGIIS